MAAQAQNLQALVGQFKLDHGSPLQQTVSAEPVLGEKRVRAVEMKRRPSHAPVPKENGHDPHGFEEF
jgi:hypothetical protein